MAVKVIIPTPLRAYAGKQAKAWKCRRPPWRRRFRR